MRLEFDLIYFSLVDLVSVPSVSAFFLTEYFQLQILDVSVPGRQQDFGMFCVHLEVS